MKTRQTRRSRCTTSAQPTAEHSPGRKSVRQIAKRTRTASRSTTKNTTTRRRSLPRDGRAGAVLANEKGWHLCQPFHFLPRISRRLLVGPDVRGLNVLVAEALDFVFTALLVEAELGGRYELTCALALRIQFDLEETEGVVDRSAVVTELGEGHVARSDYGDDRVRAFLASACNSYLIAHGADWIDAARVQFFERATKSVLPLILKQLRELLNLLVSGVAGDAEIKGHGSATHRSAGTDGDASVGLGSHLRVLLSKRRGGHRKQKQCGREAQGLEHEQT